MDPKRATDHEAQACEHVPSRVVGSEGVVAEVPGSKRASDDFVDVDHASEFTLVQTDEVSEMGGLDSTDPGRPETAREFVAAKPSRDAVLGSGERPPEIPARVAGSESRDMPTWRNA